MKEEQSPSVSTNARSIIIGTAGHIDHGKTSLVYALTGTDTDRLPEEKQRGMTIDLGFAAMQVPDGNGGMLQISLIDVPGHQAFVRNMLAGAGGIESVLLVIASDEGVKAQTLEHLEICSLLNFQRGIVTLTKTDAVDAERLEQTRSNVCALLRGTFLEDAPILPISARTGEGLPELKAALAKLAAAVVSRNDDKMLRFPPDRAFSMRGFGTIATGTLQSGQIEIGNTLELQPGRKAVRVRGIQVHGRAIDKVSAPCRVALNLSGTEPDEIHRGHTFVLPRTLQPVMRLDAELVLLPNAPALKHRARVRLHAFTGDVPATVLLYEPKERLLARLQLERPQVLVPGDRFVLRMNSPSATIGGGRVLDTFCPARKKAQALDWLLKIKDADRQEQLALRIARRGKAGVRIHELIQETGLHVEAIRNDFSFFDGVQADCWKEWRLYYLC